MAGYSADTATEHQECGSLTRTVTISEETYDYLQDWLNRDGAEAWYTAGIELDLTDFDGAIKAMANTIEFWRYLADGQLPYKRIFETDIKQKNHSSEDSVIDG